MSERISDDERTAELWALADDEHMRHLMLWQRIKKRAEAGGFNGPLASDYRRVDEAMKVLADA